MLRFQSKKKTIFFYLIPQQIKKGILMTLQVLKYKNRVSDTYEHPFLDETKKNKIN